MKNATPLPIPYLAEWQRLTPDEQFDKQLRVVIDRNNLLDHALHVQRQLDEISGAAAARRQEEVRETMGIGARLGTAPFAGVDAVSRSQEGIGASEY